MLLYRSIEMTFVHLCCLQIRSLDYLEQMSSGYSFSKVNISKVCICYFVWNVFRQEARAPADQSISNHLVMSRPTQQRKKRAPKKRNFFAAAKPAQPAADVNQVRNAYDTSNNFYNHQLTYLSNYLNVLLQPMWIIMSFLKFAIINYNV